MAATFMWSRKRKTLEGIDHEILCKLYFKMKNTLKHLGFGGWNTELFQTTL